MAAEPMRRALLGHARALAGWTAGMAAYIALVAAIFPSIRGAEGIEELQEAYPEALRELFGLGEGLGLSTGPGFLDAELFSLVLPLLVIIMAVGSGARTMAGEEDAGRLELVMAYPVRRRAVVLWKGAAVAAEIAVATLVALALLAALDPLLDLGLPAGNLAAAVGGVAALALLHGWLALALGAARPSRVAAVGVPAAVAAAGYLVGGLHELAGWLDPLRWLSPWWWLGSSPLQNGVRPWGVVVVLAAAAVTLVAGALLVERRDLETP
ncbi:ABC transporter permease subunit [Miltoncostaea marina]|uniref:ABC transporter permease subunit n=1 Tax=Miltoncostaea marina TaxID=2843215 RepID=UPI001C3E614F|nr:ABC transporter permease subunit [Miltoncostaea marina]